MEMEQAYTIKGTQNFLSEKYDRAYYSICFTSYFKKIIRNYIPQIGIKISRK